jgi:arabinogalactan oligomer/maltooligosaccharide transport system substrate-binding protein
MKKNFKLLAFAAASLISCLSISACGGGSTASNQGSAGGESSTSTGGGSSNKEKILIWGPTEHQKIYEDAAKTFIADNPDFNVEVVYGNKGDAGAYSNLSIDPSSGAAIYTYVNDMLVNLRRISAIAPLGEDDVTWIKANNTASSVASGKIGEKYFGYPITDDNGYFMFYNKDAFEGTSIMDSTTGDFKKGYTFQDMYKALDERGAMAGHEKWKKGRVTWPMGDSFYDSGVFFAVGGDYGITYDDAGTQTGVTCDFTHVGDDYTHGLEFVAALKHSMADYTDPTAVSPHYFYTDGTNPALNDFITQFLVDDNHPLAACVCGPWKTNEIRDGTKGTDGSILKAGWGTNAAATVLPILTGRTSADTELNDGNIPATQKKYQMMTFSGFKLIGVNPLCAYAKESKANLLMLKKFAKYLSSQTVQEQRYTSTGAGPSNLEALKSDTIKNDFALKALNAQKAVEGGTTGSGLPGYRIQDSVPSNYWTPIQVFGKAVYEGYANGTKGVIDSFQNVKDTLKQLQYDIIGAAQ